MKHRHATGVDRPDKEIEGASCNKEQVSGIQMESLYDATVPEVSV